MINKKYIIGGSVGLLVGLAANAILTRGIFHWQPDHAVEEKLIECYLMGAIDGVNSQTMIYLDAHRGIAASYDYQLASMAKRFKRPTGGPCQQGTLGLTLQ